jgi:hypothetical protein
MGVPLSNGSKEMIISGAKGCGVVDETSDAWDSAVIEDRPNLERDVWHYTLDGNWKSWAAGLRLQHLGIVHEDDGFATTTSCPCRSWSGATSNAGDVRANNGCIGGDRYRLKDLLPNALLAGIVEVTVVGSGKGLALLMVVFMFLLLVLDSFNGLLSILMDARIACIGAFDDIDAVFKNQPRMRSTTPVTTKRAMAGRAVGLVRPVIPSTVTRNGSFGLAGIDLGGKCLTCTNSLTSDGPDVVVLRLGLDGGFEHILENPMLVSSRALLGLTIVGEVGTKTSKEARVEAIHECLADTDGKHLLVDKRTRGCKDLSAIVEDWREDCVPCGIVVSLPDVVKSSMGLLGIPRAELVEQMIQDGRSGQTDDF